MTNSIEKWTNVVVAQKVYEGYSISTHGNLVSHLQPYRNHLGHYSTKINPNYRKPIKWHIAKTPGSNRIKCLYIRLMLPKNFFEGTYLENQTFHSKGNKTIAYRRQAHQLVMEAFHPIFENPPKRLAPFWFNLPPEVQQWIYESIIVDHKDTDPSNNRLENLHYVTAGENTRNAKAFYNGRFDIANKNNSLPSNTSSVAFSSSPLLNFIEA